MASILGIIIEHEGAEYLVGPDADGLPDVRRREPDGAWNTLKQKGPGGRGGLTAQELLGALGQPVQEDHTQQQIKKLVLLCVTRIINQFFDKARW
ncbi:hypothetical protein [Archangium primigenium]|uniref:hypothetical protein n=1 Tax=[Archangium] primigenium TaxID=2792470 RepID=UPI001956BD11|nr:hypothetical protein [Archangium primigenium]MBM7115704.1 hypothetical protein [Archangium primigenium]